VALKELGDVRRGELLAAGKDGAQPSEAVDVLVNQ
jgi:hypothetical protein